MNEIFEDDNDLKIKLLFEAIYQKYHFDFRDYSLASVRRRISLSLLKMGCANISELQAKIMGSQKIFGDLLQYLVVPVSELFRDPNYFLTFRKEIVPLLRTYPFLKIWVAGCSTGEEVYSLAIVLKEEGLLARTILYGTDISPWALERAEMAVYNADLVQKFSESYQKAGGKKSFSDYYSAAYGGLILDQELKKQITFSDHSLATDQVFSEMHFVSCRNVMIYFNRKLQDRVLGLFHEALCHKGFLGLGSKETVQFTNWGEKFKVLSKEDKLFQKI